MALIETRSSPGQARLNVKAPLLEAVRLHKDGQDPTLPLTLAEINMDEYLAREEKIGRPKGEDVRTIWVKSHAEMGRTGAAILSTRTWGDQDAAMSLLKASESLLGAVNTQQIDYLTEEAQQRAENAGNLRQVAEAHFLRGASRARQGDRSFNWSLLEAIHILKQAKDLNVQEVTEMQVRIAKEHAGAQEDPRAILRIAMIDIDNARGNEGYYDAQDIDKGEAYGKLAVAQIELGLKDDAEVTTAHLKQLLDSAENGLDRDIILSELEEAREALAKTKS